MEVKMIDLYCLLKLIAYAIIIFSIVVLIRIFWEIMSGSFQRYIEKRNDHVQRLNRIEKEIRSFDDDK
jgi:hypothetical protein